MNKYLIHEINTPWSKIATVLDVTKNPIVIGAGFKPINKLLKQLKLNSDAKLIKDSKLEGITEIVKDWIDGDLDAFRKIKLKQPGAEFMQSCWNQLRKIEGGKVLSYAQLAQRAGNAKAVRAAGSACAKNLIAPFVPCHRIIKTNGDIGNYGFGVSLKKTLLEHEGVNLKRD
jgi:methylated-DNA-[protein]-cysteine S-methyltransferase